MFNNLKYFVDNLSEAINNGHSGKEEFKFLLKALFLEIRCIIATGYTTDS